MFVPATTAQAEFTIDSATLRDKDFQLKLDEFVEQATHGEAYVASAGEWKSNVGK